MVEAAPTVGKFTMQEQSQPHSAKNTPAELEKFDEQERADIYRRAAEIQADTLFRDDDRWSAEELAAGARGAGISDEALQRAIAERERDLERQQQEKIEAAQKRAALRQKLIVGAVALTALGGVTTWATQAKLSGAYANVETTRADIDNALQRRHDLVPNLISVSKATLDKQSRLIAQLEAANRLALNAPPAQKSAAEAELTAAIAQASAKLSEVGNENTRDLVAELAGSENRITQARRQFNRAAAQYNQKARGFPTALVRPVLGYPSRIEPLQATADAREVPKF